MPYLVTAAISPLGMIAVIAIIVLFAFLAQALADPVENYFVGIVIAIVSTGVVGYLISAAGQAGTRAATHQSWRFVPGRRLRRERGQTLARPFRAGTSRACRPRRQRDPAPPILVDAGDRVIA